MNDKYILQGHKVIPVDLMTWAKWLETAGKERIVKQEILNNGMFLSTVFLGLNHNFGIGKPLLFETMLFKKKGEGEDVDVKRCSTWNEAVLQHQKMKNKWSTER